MTYTDQKTSESPRIKFYIFAAVMVCVLKDDDTVFLNWHLQGGLCCKSDGFL